MKRYLRFIRFCCLTLCRKCSSNLFTQIFHKIDVPKISEKNHGKMSVLKSPFNKVKALQFIEKGLQHMRFPVRFAKFLKTFLLKKTSRGLLPCGRIFREFSSAESLFRDNY